LVYVACCSITLLQVELSLTVIICLSCACTSLEAENLPPDRE
jgi:hypothetical protein